MPHSSQLQTALVLSVTYTFGQPPLEYAARIPQTLILSCMMISGFRCGVREIRALLGFYAA
jgi:hypothetical protein